MLLCRHVCPIVPGRYADLSRQFIDAVDRTSFVAARNHELSVDGLDDVFLRLALQVAEYALLYPLVDLRVYAHGTDEDAGLCLADGRLAARHRLKVLLQVGSSQLYTRVLLGGIADSDVLQQPTARSLFESYEWFCCPCSAGHHCSDQGEQPPSG